MLRIVMVASAVLLCACTQEQTPAPEAPVVNAKPAPVESAVEKADTLPLVVVSEAALPAAPEDGVSVHGWGAIRVGMTLDELNAALGTNVSLDGPTSDYADYQCTYLDLPEALDGPQVMYVRGKVARFSVFSGELATHGGLRLGDNASKARAVFGASLNAQGHFYRWAPSEYLTVWTGSAPPFADDAAREASRGVKFETEDDGTITSFHVGDGSIDWVEGCL